MPDDLDVLAVARGPRVGDEDAVEGEVLFCPLEFFLMMMERKAVSKGGEEEEDRKRLGVRWSSHLSPETREADPDGHPQRRRRERSRDRRARETLEGKNKRERE